MKDLFTRSYPTGLLLVALMGAMDCIAGIFLYFDGRNPVVGPLFALLGLFLIVAAPLSVYYPVLRELVRYGASINLAIPMGLIPLLWYYGLMDDPRPYLYWFAMLFIVRIAAGRQTDSQV